MNNSELQGLAIARAHLHSLVAEGKITPEKMAKTLDDIERGLAPAPEKSNSPAEPLKM